MQRITTSPSGGVEICGIDCISCMRCECEVMWDERPRFRRWHGLALRLASRGTEPESGLQTHRDIGRQTALPPLLHAEPAELIVLLRRYILLAWHRIMIVSKCSIVRSAPQISRRSGRPPNEAASAECQRQPQLGVRPLIRQSAGKKRAVPATNKQLSILRMAQSAAGSGWRHRRERVPALALPQPQPQPEHYSAWSLLSGCPLDSRRQL